MFQANLKFPVYPRFKFMGRPAFSLLNTCRHEPLCLANTVFFFFLKHKCFKKEDPVLQLMSLGWSVPFEPWLLRAGHHSCQSVSIGRMGPGSWSLLGICAHSL